MTAELNGALKLDLFCRDGALAIQNGFPCGNWNNQGKGILQLRPFNITNLGQIDLGSTKFVETDRNVDAYCLQTRDVIFNNTNSEELVGKAAIWTTGESAVLSNHMTILRVLREDRLSPEFLSFYLLKKWFDGYFHAICRRHVNQASVSVERLRNTDFPEFDVAEQRKIAVVLGLVQRAIDQQERLIALTTELKKGLLHKLFTEGLRGEPQKQTEIGSVPESWEIVRCEELCEMITVGVVVKPASHYVTTGVPAFRSFNVHEDRLVTNDLVYFSQTVNDTTLAKSKLRVGDVLVVRTGYPGTSCVVPKEYDGANCIDLVIVRPKVGVICAGYLSRFFNAPAGKSQAVASKHGLAQQHLNVGAVKRTLVPLPSLEEQDEIDSTLAAVQQKITLISAKKETLTDLFRTLLHQLMTARIRVNDLDLDEISPHPFAEIGDGFAPRFGTLVKEVKVVHN